MSSFYEFMKIKIAELTSERVRALVNRGLRALDHRGYKGVFFWALDNVGTLIRRFLLPWYYRLCRSIAVFLRLVIFNWNWKALERKYQLNTRSSAESKALRSFVCRSFSSNFYRQSDLSCAELNEAALFKHFLFVGLKLGCAPNPLFEGNYVAAQIGADFAVGFLEWFKVHKSENIKPSVLFDAEFYSRRYCLPYNSGVSAYENFVKGGVFLGRTPSPYFDPLWYLKHHNHSFSSALFYDYILLRPTARPSRNFPLNLAKSGRVSESWMYLVIAPYLLDNPGWIHSDLSDICNDALHMARSYLSDEFTGMSFKSVVLIPRCGIGGAGLVAGKLCAAISQLQPVGNVLVVITDNSMFMRPDWFSEAARVYDIFEISSDLDLTLRFDLLKLLLSIVGAKHVFNVNSNLAWDMFVEHGAQLKEKYRLYGYTFCYEVSHLGEKTGYPVTHIPKAIESLTALLVDNHFLAKDLIEQNNWSFEISSKIRVVKTPTALQRQAPDISQAPMIWAPPKKKADSPEVTIFWAGRFDRQKRLDIVVAIAKSKPDWQFKVWGAAMIGSQPDESSMPNNIILLGLFESVEDLPLDECDVWLYTSQWDGIPTILIELGLRGVPIVGSRVWGTADLLDETTSWPIDDIDDIESYQIGLNALAADPEMAAKRGMSLRDKVMREHSVDEYLKKVSEVMV